MRGHNGGKLQPKDGTAAKPLGVMVHDHIIVGKQGHASLKGLGLI